MNQRTIIVIDDEEPITHVIALKLEFAGFRVLTAQDGTAAWELIKSENADLVITDLMLPGMNGIEISMRMRAFAPTTRTPVILLSARAHTMHPEMLSRTGVRAIVWKPFGPRQLLETVVRCLDTDQDDLTWRQVA